MKNTGLILTIMAFFLLVTVGVFSVGASFLDRDDGRDFDGQEVWSG